jgi:hypothetical protein
MQNRNAFHVGRWNPFLQRALFVGLFVASAAAGFSQVTPQVDRKCQKLLDKANLVYEIDSDGDFKLVVKVQDNRTQLVWVYSNTLTYDDVEVRTIMSPALVADSDEALTAETMRLLLVDNFENKMGAWEVVERPDGGIVIQYVVKPPADASAEDLRSLIGLAAIAADMIEQQITSGDEL